MKSAMVISDSVAFPEAFRRSLVADGGDQTPDGSVQLVTPVARLLAEFDLGEGFSYDLEEPPTAVQGDGPLPTPRLERTAYVECRSEGLFIWCVQRAAQRMGEHLWVLDTDGVLWRDDRLDPSTLLL